MSEKSLFICHINSPWQTSTQPPSSLMLLLPTQFNYFNCLLLLERNCFICFVFLKIICKKVQTGLERCWKFHSSLKTFLYILYLCLHKQNLQKSCNLHKEPCKYSLISIFSLEKDVCIHFPSHKSFGEHCIASCSGVATPKRTTEELINGKYF